MKLGMEVDLGPGHIVLKGDPSPPKGHSPPFSAHVCCDQTAGWIKMLLGMEVGLCPGHIALDGDPALPKGARPPIFGPCLVANGLNGSRCHLVRRTEVGLGPGHIVFDGDPAPFVR